MKRENNMLQNDPLNWYMSELQSN